MSGISYANSGVHASSGFSFQRNCALFWYLENFQQFANKKFFLCLEHHDDFLFCFYNDRDELEMVESFQAKQSGNKWGLTSEMIDIVLKILKSGEALIQDPMPKTQGYFHSLNLITNNSIVFSVKIGKSNTQISINEANCSQTFDSMHDDLKNKIISDVQSIDQNAPVSELSNLLFRFCDLPRTQKKQKEQLIGSFVNLFRNSVVDPVAAVDTLLALFQDVELVLNQGRNPKLLDSSKRIDYLKFNAAIDVITSQQKAYELWRKKGDLLAKSLQITISERKDFELELQNCFDYFKDPSFIEHCAILEFVKTNATILSQFVTDEECIDFLLQIFKASRSSQLLEIQQKAAIVAAYIEVRG